jgi:hypothetical protein
MSIFEHAFTLIGLILGLALVEVLSSLVRALRRWRSRPVGLLTPLLAVFFIVDATGFWGILWSDRELMASIWPSLGLGMILSSLYYAAATLVFPDADVDWRDLDAYYMRHKAIVLGLMFVCFGVLVVLETVSGEQSSTVGRIQTYSYLALLVGGAVAPWKYVNAVILVLLTLIDVWVLFP